MNQIKFSHKYPKLHEQTKARLLGVYYLTDKDINDKLKEYDTKYYYNERTDHHGTIQDYNEGYYELPKGLKLQLVFIGNRHIPFCTIRRHTPEKEKYYRQNIGEWFNIIIK